MESWLVEILPCSVISIAPRSFPPKKNMILDRYLSYAHVDKRKFNIPLPLIGANWEQIYRIHLAPLRQNPFPLPRPYRYSRFPTTRPAKLLWLYPNTLHRLGAQPFLPDLNSPNARWHMDHHLPNERTSASQSVYEDTLRSARLIYGSISEAKSPKSQRVAELWIYCHERSICRLGWVLGGGYGS